MMLISLRHWLLETFFAHVGHCDLRTTVTSNINSTVESFLHSTMLLRSLSNSGRSNSPTLPTKSFPSTSSVFVPRRYARLVLLGLLSLCALVFLYYRQARDASGFLIPPRYEKYHEYEENLPQHNLDLPYPEGRDAKYFWASNHVTRAYLHST